MLNNPEHHRMTLKFDGKYRNTETCTLTSQRFIFKGGEVQSVVLDQRNTCDHEFCTYYNRDSKQIVFYENIKGSAFILSIQL